jgi:hypothetical protein
MEGLVMEALKKMQLRDIPMNENGLREELDMGPKEVRTRTKKILNECSGENLEDKLCDLLRIRVFGDKEVFQKRRSDEGEKRSNKYRVFTLK